jgi:Phage tail lysozyme
LTDNEWQRIDIWLSRGEVGIDPLTDNAEHNADLVAAALFNERRLYVPDSGREDPLLGVLTEVTIADLRVQALERHVVSRGPIIHWPAVPTSNRLVYAMERLIDTHGYPVNGAAGIVGNLLAESGVLPGRVEGSAAATPMRAANFAGQRTDFSPDEVQDRNRSASVGPRRPGVGLAQWTTPARRAGLFQRTAADGRELGASVLFNMDAQIGYLVSELQAATGLNASLTAGGVSVNDASDNVLYQFEIPGSILDASGSKLSRTDPAVQTVFATRRNNANQALAAYQAVHP